MDGVVRLRSALIVVDMLRENLHGESRVARTGRAIIPSINRLIAGCREMEMPIIFACDSFLPQDFLFRSRVKPHCIRGTEGCKVVDEIAMEASDLVLEKRRLSAFFKTDLDQTLRTWGIEQVAVCGITTPYCVLTTALDAVSHDFYSVIIKDCTASQSEERHDTILNLYANGPLFPLLRVMDSHQFLEEQKGPP
jgi:nicotinamidase/pyrazinamidase